MDALLQILVAQLAAQSIAEWVAVVLAVGYVFLAARQSIWCWPCALVSTGIYTWLFWEVTLPFNSALNAYYLAMAVYGWFKWNRQGEETLVVTSWPISRHILAIVGLAAVAAGMSMLAGGVFNAEYLWLDAYITVFSVFTTVLVAHKVLENWLYWMVINLFAAYLYASSGLLPTAILFISYFGFSIYGYLSWRKQSSAVETLSVQNT